MDLHPNRPASISMNLHPNSTGRIGCKSIEITLPVKGIRPASISMDLHPNRPASISMNLHPILPVIYARLNSTGHEILVKLGGNSLGLHYTQFDRLNLTGGIEFDPPLKLGVNLPG